MKKLLTLALVGAATLVASSSYSFAQRDTCFIVNGQKCYVVYDADNNVISNECSPENPGGQGVFNEQEPISRDGAVNATLTPESVTASFDIPQLGRVDVSLDQAAAQPQTTINSVGADRFPLSVNIAFNAQAHVSSEADDISYVSTTPLEFANDNVNSVKPFRNETFVLTRDVNFTRPDSPDHIEFTLTAGSSLTLGGSDEAGDGGVGVPGDPDVH